MVMKEISTRDRFGPGATALRGGPTRSSVGWRRFVAATWVFLAAVVLGYPVECSAARWYEDYERAVELTKDGQCSREALQLLGAAVVDKKKPKRNARTIAVKTVDYLPYYQLARAHLACGESDSALHYIEESRKRKVADGAALNDLERRAIEFGNSTSSRSEPAVDLDELSGLAKEAQNTIRQAISASERVNSRRGSEWLGAFFSENNDTLTKAQDDLTEAQEALNDGTLKQDRTAIKNAESFASRALVVFTGLDSEMAALHPPEPTPEPVVVRSTPRPTSTSAPRRIPTRVTVVPTPRPTSRPSTAGPAASTAGPDDVPASFRKAAANYVTAGYDEVVRELEPSDYPSTGQQAAAYLLRAAAHFAIYCLDGREDGERLGLVRSDIARSQELDPSLSPDPLIFSPEFVDLYR